VPTETLQWPASITVSTPQGVPFGRKGKEASMSKYRAVGHRYLSMCWRAHRLGREQAAEQWAIRFTDNVDVVYELGCAVDGHGSQTDEATGGSDDEEADEETATTTKPMPPAVTAQAMAPRHPHWTGPCSCFWPHRSSSRLVATYTRARC
jgi:hypothetical protein